MKNVLKSIGNNEKKTDTHKKHTDFHTVEFPICITRQLNNLNNNNKVITLIDNNINKMVRKKNINTF